MLRFAQAGAVVAVIGVLAQPSPDAQPAAPSALADQAASTGSGQAASTSSGQGAPTIDDLIALKRVGSPAISPDGQRIAYTVREANWDDNNYHTEIWLADAKSGETRQLTSHPKKSSASPAWSPDGTSLAFTTDRDDKRQIVYKGFEGVGHGPSKPKSSRAVMQHNLEWFDKYLFATASQTSSQQEK